MTETPFQHQWFRLDTVSLTLTRCHPNALRYEVLNVLEYSSARARMSVIVRGPDGGIQMFCKGADAKVGDPDVPRLA